MVGPIEKLRVEPRGDATVIRVAGVARGEWSGERCTVAPAHVPEVEVSGGRAPESESIGAAVAALFEQSKK